MTIGCYNQSRAVHAALKKLATEKKLRWNDYRFPGYKGKYFCYFEDDKEVGISQDNCEISRRAYIVSLEDLFEKIESAALKKELDIGNYRIILHKSGEVEFHASFAVGFQMSAQNMEKLISERAAFIK